MSEKIGQLKLRLQIRDVQHKRQEIISRSIIVEPADTESAFPNTRRSRCNYGPFFGKIIGNGW